MTTRSTQKPEISQVESRLSELPGVRDVDLSHYPDRVSLHCDPTAVSSLASEAIKEMLRLESDFETDVQVELAARDALAINVHRLRFDKLEVSRHKPGLLSARTTLEWRGELLVGEADGEPNPAGELRVSADATAKAVERAMSGAASFNLIGVKEMRVFDHDMVVVLLDSPQLPRRRMLGISVIVEDRRASAAKAVLNATNRTVGLLSEAGLNVSALSR